MEELSAGCGIGLVDQAGVLAPKCLRDCIDACRVRPFQDQHAAARGRVRWCCATCKMRTKPACEGIFGGAGYMGRSVLGLQLCQTGIPRVQMCGAYKQRTVMQKASSACMHGKRRMEKCMVMDMECAKLPGPVCLSCDQQHHTTNSCTTRTSFRTRLRHQLST